MDSTTPTRVDVTGEAAALVRRLTGTDGPLMFHQSGGCCDGSAPMCFPDGEVPMYMSTSQFAYWRYTHLTVDVVPGRGAGFSVEAPEGVRFLTRSRLFEDAEWEALAAAGEPRRGA